MYYTNATAGGDLQTGLGNSSVVAVTAATTLTGDDSGKTLILNAATGAAISLPAVANIVEGWNIKVKTGLAFATTNWTIVAATAVIQGFANVNNTLVQAADETTITFVHTADTVGDFVEIEFDGTNFLVNGIGFAAGSITFT